MRLKLRHLAVVGAPTTLTYFYSTQSTKAADSACRIPHLHAKQKQLQLKQVQVVFRHGARTPINYRKGANDTLQSDSVMWDKEKFGYILEHVNIPFTVVDHRDESVVLNMVEDYRTLPGGCVCGNLTTIGQQEAYDFGQWLASEYITKQPFVSSPKDLYVRSTLKSRTVQTAEGVIAGMYGVGAFQDEGLLIRSMPLPEDNLLPNLVYCRRLNDRFRHHWYNTKDKQEEMNRNLGVAEGEELYNFVQLVDVMTQRHHHGLYVPPYLLDNRTELTQLGLDMLLDILGRGNVEELRTSVGGFVDIACRRLEAAMAGVDSTKMILYSSHDTGVMCFLLVLGVFDGEWPSFLANVVVELYKETGQERSGDEGPGHEGPGHEGPGHEGCWYVRVLYNGEPVVVDKETGDQYMRVEKLLQLVEKYRVEDWNECCGNVKKEE